MRTTRAHARAGAAVLVALALALATGCGSSSPDAGPATAAPRTDSETSPPSAVSVLSARAAVAAGGVEVALRLRQPADVDPPIAETAQLTLPAGIAWRGADAPACDAKTLERGVDACPAGAVVGHGEAIGLADTARTVGRITVVNGGADRVYLVTVVRHPAFVDTVVPGTIARTGGGLRLAFRFPPELQTIAGVPVGLQQLRLTVPAGPALAVADCPATGWRYAARVDFDDGAHVAHAGTATCSAR